MNEILNSEPAALIICFVIVAAFLAIFLNCFLTYENNLKIFRENLHPGDMVLIKLYDKKMIRCRVMSKSIDPDYNDFYVLDIDTKEAFHVSPKFIYQP